ncbi:hypothetical protein BKA66DRAFT_446566 [Pyrenochaeta sp. MPI-SDFR-AT-0127]|nr:hypothetical protein BKA66DRAFT_446566 [Pyrenochaeta sp. MPI-SDFR-AT-0127]
MMRIMKSIALVAAVLCSLAASELSCYYPDGKNATGLTPCKPNADVSHCCREADVCQTNGMCFSPGLGAIVRRGCTDRTWNSPDCPNACIIDGFRSGDAVLTPCGSYNRFCCGDNKAARTCCDDGSSNLTAQVAGGEPMFTEIIYPSSCSAVAGMASATATVTVTPSTSCQSSANSSSNTQRTAVIGVGAALGAVLALVGGLALLWRRSMAKKTQALEHENSGLNAENQRLKQALPGPIRREMENAKINATIIASEGRSP